MRRVPQRRWLAALAVLGAACASLTASERRDERLRAALDAHAIHRPLASVWPAALRLLAERGHQLVGRDRARVGQDPAPLFRRLTGSGFATTPVKDGLVLETMEDQHLVRYRVEGLERGGAACQVRFVAIRRTESSPSEERSRDLELELELVGRVAPEEAERLRAEAGLGGGARGDQVRQPAAKLTTGAPTPVACATSSPITGMATLRR